MCRRLAQSCHPCTLIVNVPVSSKVRGWGGTVSIGGAVGAGVVICVGETTHIVAESGGGGWGEMLYYTALHGIHGGLAAGHGISPRTGAHRQEGLSSQCIQHQRVLNLEFAQLHNATSTDVGYHVLWVLHRGVGGGSGGQPCYHMQCSVSAVTVAGRGRKLT